MRNQPIRIRYDMNIAPAAPLTFIGTYAFAHNPPVLFISKFENTSSINYLQNWRKLALPLCLAAANLLKMGSQNLYSVTLNAD